MSPTNRWVEDTHFVKPYVIPEVRVAVQLDAAAVRGALALDIAPEDMDDTMLDLFSHVREVHEVAAPSWTLDLHLVTVVLVEPLETLDQEEIDRKPYKSSASVSRCESSVREHTQIGPRQFELPPNMPDIESPGQ